MNNLLERFLKYVKIDTRSNPNSNTIPSTKSQVEFAHLLIEEMKQIGLSNCYYDETSGFAIGELESNIDREVDTIGFIAHMDTADFNSENINPQIIENYDGESDINLDKEGKYILSPSNFPNLKNYKGDTLITTDGTTLLGADDKAGIAEILTAMEFLIANPDIKHGKVKVAFGPDEEIGSGANNFNVEDFGADFAYTIDGGPLGELQYENFNAATATVEIQGTNVHPGSAKGKMVNSLLLAHKIQASLPEKDLPEHTEMYEGFYLLDEMSGNVDKTTMTYLIRDHDKDKFEARKKALEYIVNKINKELDDERIKLNIKDSYFNMKEVLKDHMHIIDLAEKAMLRLDIEPIVDPVRGGTDGARLSYMGLPTPNIFAGGENLHGRYEFVSLQTMEKACQLIVEIIKLNANPM